MWFTSKNYFTTKYLNEFQREKKSLRLKTRKAKTTSKKANQKCKQKKKKNTNIEVVTSSSESEHEMRGSVHKNLRDQTQFW